MLVNEAEVISTDIVVIEAEINSYKQIAGHAIFEIGKRLKHVKENRLVHGEFGIWAESMGFNRSNVSRYIRAYEQFGNSLTSTKLEVGKILEMLSLPETISREEFISKDHEIPSTREVKSVEEMTVRELREVKKALKVAESQRELALKDAQILRDTLESIEDKEPEIEIRTEYVKVTDEASEQKLRKYEEMFGDVSMYEGKTTRVTNGDAITYSVFEFTEDVRKFVEKYGHLTHFAKEFNGMIGEGKAEYFNAIQSMFSLLKSIERNLDESEVIIINQ